MPDDRAAQAPVQPEERHQVHRRQRDAGDLVEVRAVGGVQPDRVHRAREQLGVDLVRAPVAVLVGLDLDHRGLRLPHRRGSAHVCGSASLS